MNIRTQPQTHTTRTKRKFLTSELISLHTNNAACEFWFPTIVSYSRLVPFYNRPPSIKHRSSFHVHAVQLVGFNTRPAAGDHTITCAHGPFFHLVHLLKKNCLTTRVQLFFTAHRTRLKRSKAEHRSVAVFPYFADTD